MFGALFPFTSPTTKEINFSLLLVSVWMSFFKRIVKKIADLLYIRPARRPPNEEFPRGIYYGGFPSGHVSQTFGGLIIVAYLWGINTAMGYAMLIQLMLTLVWVLVSNRHYVSQAVAAVAMGLLYAFAIIQCLNNVFGKEALALQKGNFFKF